MKRRFSIKLKLLVIFGLLASISVFVLGFLAIRIAGKAVTEKIEAHLIDKAIDTAQVVDGRVNAFFQFLEGVARTPILQEGGSYEEKSLYLKKEAAFNDKIRTLGIADLAGNLYKDGARATDASEEEWHIRSKQGKNFIGEPIVSKVDGALIIILSVPIYGENKNIIGILNATVDGLILSHDIRDIVVGKTGYCYILGKTGIDIADKEENIAWVKEQRSSAEEAKKNGEYESLAAFDKKALISERSDVDFFWFEKVYFIASFAKIKSTDWTAVIMAPVGEFMGTVETLKRSMFFIGISILISALVVVFLIAHALVKPISKVVAALKDISQGEGDLTVRLPIHGNDEITDLSRYFNQTIEKIGTAIKSVGGNAKTMQSIGEELSSNMTETASSINQIGNNIEGVKEQVMTQAASVTETAATVEQIIRTIKHLNNSIETQAASVAQSSASVEQMVANIGSITQTLGKSDGVIKELAAATADGKETLSSSNVITQKIAEESGSLMEASSVIQHIASQTNLLAMNAAIEAAHAGDAGKGFAVVADEIRKLAEESSAQGKSITSTLKTLSGEIEILSEASKTVEEKFNAIFSLAENVKEMSNRIMEAMHEQENGSREVLSAIRNINEVTVEVKAGSEEMLKGGEGVADEMNKLDGLTRTITDSMNEMASGAIQINNAVQEVNEITQKNKMSIEALAQEVGKFRV
ncbi:methyl-accepting chemotaxis protein [Treponema pedis]|uniref:Methyl-accepting chemotaxis protein n=3 Tax=Treponema pedis TaxID=409322 RepID=S5ZL48_9SPIR|nr:methyl-accepting chemotaxis protein [Treponema pedis]AGT43297.1 methyl-accepting chemotaxis protein [Treponema pedis str. T A4]